MRLDKFLSEMAVFSRRECATEVKKGNVAVDGITAAKPDMHIDPEKSTVTVNGKVISYRPFEWILLNKPEGYVSSTDDPGAPTVLELLGDRERKLNLFPCGRLDRNTVGLLLLTNDGATAHRLLAPKTHVDKEYAFRVKFPLSEADLILLRNGIEIEGGYTTLPCEVTLTGEKEGRIVLHEGKYHQIKLMMKAVHNQITYLQRIRFGNITLDSTLSPGEWRPLTDGEIASLTKNE